MGGEESSDTHTSVSCLERREMELDLSMPVASWYKHSARGWLSPHTYVSLGGIRWSVCPRWTLPPCSPPFIWLVQYLSEVRLWILEHLATHNAFWQCVTSGTPSTPGPWQTLLIDHRSQRASTVEAWRRKKGLSSPVCVTSSPPDNSPTATGKQLVKWEQKHKRITINKL